MNDNSVADKAADVKREYVRIVSQNFPQELQDLAQWVLWRSEKRNGKLTKIPYRVDGRLAESNQPATWASFDEVCAAYLGGQYDGLGFVFNEHDPYCGIDFDGGAADHAGMVRTLDSYSERSPSGKGVHVIVIGTLPAGGRKSSKHKVEMYDRLRFFTVTGDHIPDTPTTIEPRQAELEQLHAEIFPNKPKPKLAPAPAQPVDLDDQALLDKMFASKQGAKIRALWTGDTNGYGDDDSAADQALCNYLAFWTGRDAARMDRLFRQSGLMRDKWDRRARTGETYGEGTIRKALEDVREGYTNGRRPVNATQTVVDHGAGSNGAEPPPAAAPSWENCTDLGNARRLVALHGADLHYVHSFGKWFIWDGRRWVEDETGEIERRAKATVASIYREAASCTDDDERKRLAKWALASESKTRIAAMIALAQSEPGIPIRHDELDANLWLLNCANGVVDLKTGQLLPHDRTHLCTKLIDVPYDPQATAARWLRFVSEIMSGDAEMVGFLRRAAGYSLTGSVHEQVLFFLYGMGSNGKSTFLEILLSLLGDYGQKAPTELIMMKRNDGGVPNDVARLVGRRLVVTAEIEGDRRLAESLVKDLTGGDKLVARFMRQEYFEFHPTHKLWIYGNHKPVIRGTDKGIWRRLNTIPFSVQFTDNKDPYLKDKLLAELPGILAWAVGGCLEWQRDGLKPPATVQKATDNYRAEMDVIAGFIDECCVINPSCVTPFADLYEEYRKYCDRYREHYEKQRRFGDSLTERGFMPDKGTGNRSVRRGIGLLIDDEK